MDYVQINIILRSQSSPFFIYSYFFIPISIIQSVIICFIFIFIFWWPCDACFWFYIIYYLSIFIQPQYKQTTKGRLILLIYTSKYIIQIEHAIHNHPTLPPNNPPPPPNNNLIKTRHSLEAQPNNIWIVNKCIRLLQIKIIK